MIRAVVFDFDGVLSNSEPLHLRAYQDVLAGLDLVLTERAYYSTYLGYDDRGAFRAMLADQGRPPDEELVEDLVQRKARRMEALMPGADMLFPGARAAIERLAPIYPLAIASGALRAEILDLLEHEHLTACFRTVIGAEDAAAGKPAPDPYLRAIEQLGASIGSALSAGACVAVEDSRWGLQSARAAGLRTIAVTHTYSPETLTDADAIISHLDQLTPEWLASL